MKTSSYKKFLLMMGISFLVMYFVMYLNLASLSHFYFNINRAYMAFLMVAPMALIMLAFMRGMYTDKKLNLVIAAGSILLFFGVLFLERSQTPVGDKAFMRSMIPHHSSAILVSENADLSDPEVKKLAEQIIKSQKEEIAQMKAILERMENEK